MKNKKKSYKFKQIWIENNPKDISKATLEEIKDEFKWLIEENTRTYFEKSDAYDYNGIMELIKTNRKDIDYFINLIEDKLNSKNLDTKIQQQGLN